ncbi:MAG: hypothetical protein JNM24_07460 [Bdellovibrionaceae bacterium]|nr:hypothetical protein [Pseudobdellovibrionaceae bacterium]
MSTKLVIRFFLVSIFCFSSFPVYAQEQANSEFAMALQAEINQKTYLSPGQRAQQTFAALEKMTEAERNRVLNTAEKNAQKLLQKIQNEEGKVLRAKTTNQILEASEFLIVLSGAAAGFSALIRAFVWAAEMDYAKSLHPADIKAKSTLNRTFVLGSLATAVLLLTEDSRKKEIKFNNEEINQIEANLINMKKLAQDESALIDSLKAYFRMSILSQ